MVVAVDVVDGVDAVGAGGEAAHGELAELVGARHALEGEGADGGIGHGVGAVDAYEHALGGLEVLGGEHHAGDAQRIDGGACGEVDGEAVEHVAFVEVFDGVAEVDGVCGGGDECVAQFDAEAASVGADAWRRALHGRHDDFVERVVELYVFVEQNREACGLHAGGSWSGACGDKDGGLGVARAALGAPYACACRGKERSGGCHERQKMSPISFHEGKFSQNRRITQKERGVPRSF